MDGGGICQWDTQKDIHERAHLAVISCRVSTGECGLIRGLARSQAIVAADDGNQFLVLSQSEQHFVGGLAGEFQGGPGELYIQGELRILIFR